MEMLEFEEEEENNFLIDSNDDDIYDITDLFCEEDDEKESDLWLSCDKNPSAHLVQPCGHMICTNCVKKNNHKFCGSRKSHIITIDLDDFEWHFDVFQCFNFNGAPAHFFFNLFHLVNFCKTLTFLCLRCSNKIIDRDKFKEVVDFGPSFCFFSEK